jgi:hypothetical protein
MLRRFPGLSFGSHQLVVGFDRPSRADIQLIFKPHFGLSVGVRTLIRLGVKGVVIGVRPCADDSCIAAPLHVHARQDAMCCIIGRSGSGIGTAKQHGEQKTGEPKPNSAVFYFHLNITGIDGCLPSTAGFIPVAFHLTVTEHDDPAGEVHHHVVVGGENKGYAALPIHLPHQFEKAHPFWNPDWPWVRRPEQWMDGIQWPVPPPPAAAGRRTIRPAAGRACLPGRRCPVSPGRAAGVRFSGYALQQHDILNVFNGRQHGDQVVGLENETDAMQAQIRHPGTAQFLIVLAIDPNRAAIRLVQAADQVEQGGFSRARGPGQGDESAGVNGKIDILKRIDSHLALPVTFGYPIACNDCCHCLSSLMRQW